MHIATAAAGTVARRITRQMNVIEREYRGRLTGAWALFDADGRYLGYREQQVISDGIHAAWRVRVRHEQPWNARQIAAAMSESMDAYTLDVPPLELSR